MAPAHPRGPRKAAKETAVALLYSEPGRAGARAAAEAGAHGPAPRGGEAALEDAAALVPGFNLVLAQPRSAV